MFSHRLLRCFLAKNATAGGLHCTETCSALHFASIFSVFSCVCRISHRCLRCFCRLSICLSALCGGGGGGVMTSMRMRLVSSVSFVASCASRISHRFLRCFCRLSSFCTCQLRLAFAFQLWGGDDVHANAACVFCFFCCVTSQTLPVAL